MKKLIAVAVVAALTVAGAVAQVTVGARGNVGLNVGTTDNLIKTYNNTGVLVPYGAGAFVRYNMPFYAPVGAEFDFDFGMNQGTNSVFKSNSDNYRTRTYNVIDMALLGTYTMNFDAFGITFVAGPNICLPVSNLSYVLHTKEANSDPIEYEFNSSVIFGIKAGVEGSYKVGPGNVVVGLSYVNDFNPIELKGNTYSHTRRNLNLSVGYAIQF